MGAVPGRRSAALNSDELMRGVVRGVLRRTVTASTTAI
jgi:hypothetical protein